MRKTMILAGTVLLFAASLLFLPGCQNSLQQSPGMDDPRMGSVALAIGHERMGRTIMPDNVTELYLRLVFTPVDTGTSIERLAVTPTADTMEVPVGDWNVVITGYLTDARTGVVGTATVNGFEVEDTGTNTLTATLSPIASGPGTGTFSWNITAPAGTTGTIAVAGEGPAQPFGTGTGQWATAILAGNHHVTLTLANNGNPFVITSSLQIFQNMTSIWNLPVTEAMFLRSLEDIILGSRRTGTWNLVSDGLTEVHFALIDIDGLGVYDIDDIEPAFNTISATAVPPLAGPYTLPRLAQLADATLISFAPDTVTDPTTAHVSTAAAAAALIARIENDTTVAYPTNFNFVWTADTHYVATVTVGPYQATVTFAAGAIDRDADGIVGIDINIAGFTFANAAGGFSFDPVPTITYAALRAGTGGASTPLLVTVTGGTSWSINGVNQGGITDYEFYINYTLVNIGTNHVTLYVTEGGRNYSIALPLVVTP